MSTNTPSKAASEVVVKTIATAAEAPVAAAPVATPAAPAPAAAPAVKPSTAAVVNASAQAKVAQPPKAINTGVRAATPAAAAPVATPAKPVAASGTVNPQTRLGSAVAEINKKAAVEKVKSPAEVVGDLLKEVPAAYQYPITRLYDYIARMNPNQRENEKVGVGEQAALYHSIVTIINGPEDYFAPLFTALLRLFQTYSVSGGVFHEYNSSRYMQVVNLNTDERKALNNLTCFLRLMCNPQTRQIVARTTDHVRLLAYGLTDTGRNRVTSFLEL